MQTTRRTTIITILVILIIAVVLVLAAILIPRYLNRSDYGDLVNLPEIEMDIYSSADGSSHMVAACFTLEVEDSSDINTTAVTNTIKELMAELDYDMITSEGSVQYIKDEIKDGLTSYGLDTYVQNLYLRDLSSGDVKIISSDNQTSERSDGRATVNDILQGMGGNKK